VAQLFSLGHIRTSKYNQRINMNKTVLGIMGFLLLTPGLVLLGSGRIFVGFLLCVAGAGLLLLAIRPEWFKRYIVTLAALFCLAAVVLLVGLFSKF
jgi:hypothetical protein